MITRRLTLFNPGQKRSSAMRVFCGSTSLSVVRGLITTPWPIAGARSSDWSTCGQLSTAPWMTLAEVHLSEDFNGSSGFRTFLGGPLTPESASILVLSHHLLRIPRESRCPSYIACSLLPVPDSSHPSQASSLSCSSPGPLAQIVAALSPQTRVAGMLCLHN